jgi:hypothetical protein
VSKVIGLLPVSVTKALPLQWNILASVKRKEILTQATVWMDHEDVCQVKPTNHKRTTTICFHCLHTVVRFLHSGGLTAGRWGREKGD